MIYSGIMPRLTRKEQQEQNRLLLLEAAERTFASRGVAKTSIEDVAAEARLTKGAVYSNFRNKGELILEVIRHRQTDSAEAERFHSILANAEDDFARLEAWCDIWIETARGGDRVAYARLLFDFIPYALQDDDLSERFLAFITPPEAVDQPTPIPDESPFAAIPRHDQFRILTALDLGLSALRLFDPQNVDPGLYKTAVMALAHTSRRPPVSELEDTGHQ